MDRRTPTTSHAGSILLGKPDHRPGRKSGYTDVEIAVAYWQDRHRREALRRRPEDEERALWIKGYHLIH